MDIIIIKLIIIISIDMIAIAMDIMDFKFILQLFFIIKVINM